MFHTSRVHSFLGDVIHIGCVFSLVVRIQPWSIDISVVFKTTASLNWFQSYAHAMVLRLYYRLLTGMKGFLKRLDEHPLIPSSRMSYSSYPKRRRNLFIEVGWVPSWCVSDIMDNKADSLQFLLLQLSKSGSIVTPWVHVFCAVWDSSSVTRILTRV